LYKFPDVTVRNRAAAYECVKGFEQNIPFMILREHTEGVLRKNWTKLVLDLTHLEEIANRSDCVIGKKCNKAAAFASE
jgi:hypothetical protein